MSDDLPTHVQHAAAPCCRFIWAFGGTGVFTFLAAASGLVGVAANSPRMLGLYSVLLCTLLLGQAFLGVAFFADDTWRKHLPPDASGEATEVCVPCLQLQGLGCCLSLLCSLHLLLAAAPHARSTGHPSVVVKTNCCLPHTTRCLAGVGLCKELYLPFQGNCHQRLSLMVVCTDR